MRSWRTSSNHQPEKQFVMSLRQQVGSSMQWRRKRSPITTFAVGERVDAGGSAGRSRHAGNE